MLRTRLVSLIGRGVAGVSRWRGGHGSALPGLVVEKLHPHFLHEILSELPLGCAVVTGTNGKTTTTKMVTELLQAAGLRVFTNPSGSNFTRGVVSAALPLLRGGRLPADVAVVELDEAYAVHFVREIAPRYCLLLNVLRDQLDRFGEIDTTARYLQSVAGAATDAVVLNADDPRVAAMASLARPSARVSWFGLDPSLRGQFPTDEELHEEDAAASVGPGEALTRPLVGANGGDQVTLAALDGQRATYLVDGTRYDATLQLYGPHNALNAASALALTRAILGDRFDASSHVTRLNQVTAAFGRGEIWHLGERSLRLTLVKNPSGFRLALAGTDPSAPTLIAINDHSADGRDISWLWDVDFTAVAPCPSVATTGIRAADMALRLEYAGIPVASVEPDLTAALSRFLQETRSGPLQIFSSYTAMLKLRASLKELAAGSGVTA